MNTVRRLYFYGLALVSAEVIIWGVVNLLRTIFLRGSLESIEALTSGLSLLVVGIPIFLLHWRVAQRDAARDPEERASRVRGFFLYGALFATLSPMVYALMAVVNRAMINLMGFQTSRAWFGSEGIAADNLIALVINAAAFAYFWSVTLADWRAETPEHFLADNRRLYRYVWMVTGLTLAISAVYNLLRFFLNIGEAWSDSAPVLAGGLVLLLVGGPLFAYFWWQVQSSRAEPEERASLLRLVVLYLISLAGVTGVMATVGTLLANLLQWVTGQANTLVNFLSENATPLAAAVPLAVMWVYFGRILNLEVAAVTDQPRRGALRRIYHYILCLFGLFVTVVGIISLVDFLARWLLDRTVLAAVLRSAFSGGMAAVLVGAPIWLYAWRQMQREAARRDEAGDHARRSVIRKSYLYLMLFLFVLATMAYTGLIINMLLDALFGNAAANFLVEIVTAIFSLAVVAAFLVYHLRVLRQDGRAAQQTVGGLHAAFPTLVLVESEGYGLDFANALLQIMPRVAPRLPIAVHTADRGAPDESLLAAKAVLLTPQLAIEPPESLRLWLSEYAGQRIILPVPGKGWRWLGQPEKHPAELAREAAQTLRQMAEGQAARAVTAPGPWVVVGLVLGGIFALFLLLTIFSVAFSALFD